MDGDQPKLWVTAASIGSGGGSGSVCPTSMGSARGVNPRYVTTRSPSERMVPEQTG
ncbi:hypothetical protein D3C75_1325100 [compost metagenome]